MTKRSSSGMVRAPERRMARASSVVTDAGADGTFSSVRDTALVVPIECHHTVARPEVRERLPGPHRTATEVIAVANLLARHIVPGIDSTIGPPPEDLAAQTLLETLGIGAGMRGQLYARASAQLERARPFLQVLDGK